MAKIKSWLDRHNTIRTILLWNGWSTVVLVLFILQVVFGITVYYSGYIYTFLTATKLPIEVLKHYEALLAELRQFIQMLTGPTCLTAVIACARFVYDPDKDGVPNILQEEVKKL